MSLPFGLLGLLKYQDSTGYELTKMFEYSLNNFWHAQSSQIYRELNRMEEKGWVTSRSVVQDKRPNKRVYSITGEGLSALQEWLTEAPPPFENQHEPLLMRVFFGADAPEVTLELLKTIRDMCLVDLEELPKKAIPSINRYASALPEGKKHQLYWEMTLNYGIAQIRLTAEWAQQCIEKIEKELRT